MVYYKQPKSNRDDMIKEQQLVVPDTDNASIEEKKRVLRVLKRTSASYLGEIAWEANLSEYQAKTIINLLSKDKLIERLSVDFHRPDVRLLYRVADQSAQGQGGFEAFSRKHWYAITDAGRRFIDE